MSSEKYRWMLVDDHIQNFNNHRAKIYYPSQVICVDESISRWYGIGGYWINAGLPQYIAIDRKPEDGCEIQNAADGVTGIMMRLKLVKTSGEEAECVEHDGNLNHGTNVLLELTEAWHNTSIPRIVCADSYFASVQAADQMYGKKMRFIGPVKTATKGFPLKTLQSIELEKRGDYRGLWTKDKHQEVERFAFVWMDRERRNFISNTSSLDEGKPYKRTRFRQEDKAKDADPEHVTFEIKQPKAAEVYYSACGKIDHSNRIRQNEFQMERKLETKQWDIRVNTSILGMIDVDTYLLGKQCKWWDDKDPKEFHYNLAEEMIENTWDARNLRKRKRTTEVTASGSPSLSLASDPHCTPTRCKKKNSRHTLQGRCKICHKCTIHVCSHCTTSESDSKKQVWVCPPVKGTGCLQEHIKDKHSFEEVNNTIETPI